MAAVSIETGDCLQSATVLSPSHNHSTTKPELTGFSMNIKGTIYLDHQATTPLDPDVLDSMRPFTGDAFGNPHSSDHSVGWKAAQAVERSAANVADLIGADAGEIIFTSGATESNNTALLGLAKRSTAKAGRDRVLLGATEHKCVLEVGRILERDMGFKVEHIPVDDEGRINADVLEDMLDKDVLAVSLMAVNNEIGTVQDIGAVSALCRKHGALVHCDAAQAPLSMDLTGIAADVDLLSLSSHKIYGPMGIGALYIRHDLQTSIEPLIYGGGQQSGLRSGTLPTALCVGFGKAATLATGDRAETARKSLAANRDYLLDKLQALPFPISVNGPKDMKYRHPGNLNVSFVGVGAEDFLGQMQPRLAASTGSACTSGITEPSHVLKAIGLDGRQASSAVRFSLGRQTSRAHLDEAVEIIHSTLAEMHTDGLLESA